MFTGTITAAAVYPREIIKAVLRNQAAAVIAVHNHPSGEPEPSPEDIALTFQIMIALNAIGVTLHDHTIIGNSSHFSMADNGFIARFKERITSLQIATPFN